MAKRKPKPKKAKSLVTLARTKARHARQRQINRIARQAISQALSETLLQLTWEGGNQS